MPRQVPFGITPRAEWWPDSHNLATIRECGKRGLNFRMTAQALGISPSTWSDKVKKYPAMLQAWEAGRAEGAFEVGGKLYQNATERARDKDGNAVGPIGGVPSAQVAYMKHVAGWTDKVELTGVEGAPIPVQIILPSNGHELPKGAANPDDTEGDTHDENLGSAKRPTD